MLLANITTANIPFMKLQYYEKLYENWLSQSTWGLLHKKCVFTYFLFLSKIYHHHHYWHHYYIYYHQHTNYIKCHTDLWEYSHPPDIAPPSVHRTSWRYIDDGGKSKYRNFKPVKDT
jgi:hypothetical protein